MKTFQRSIIVGAAALCAAAFAGAPATAAPAETATAIDVVQLPAYSVQVGYLMLPNSQGFAVKARSAGEGKVQIVAGLGEDGCWGGGGNWGAARVSIDYVNVNTGKTGTDWVRPCQSETGEKRKTETVIEPGSGRVVMSINVSETGAPAPGPLNFPGAATFVVR